MPRQARKNLDTPFVFRDTYQKQFDKTKIKM